MPTETELFHQLSLYTLQDGGPEFLHQTAVDAFTAQQADEESKAIAVVFALIGLYLHVEKGFTGGQVQRAHMRLAGKRKQWPRLALPDDRGRIRVSDVLAEPPGTARDAKIQDWCVSVWNSFRDVRPAIVRLVADELDIE
jgi:hypothetical protein